MTSLLTHSRIKSYRTCPRLHHLRYELGYRPAREADALRFGTLVHKGLEAWWRAKDGERLEAGIAAIADHPEETERAKARALVSGYDAKWSGERFEVLAVEQEFAFPLVNPSTGEPVADWMVAGKMDAVARDAAGRTLVVEHKTSSTDFSAGSAYAQKLRLDSQVSIYFAGAAALGYDVEGVLYDVIAKPQQKRKQATREVKLKKDGTPRAGQNLEDESLDAFEARLLEEVVGNLDNYFGRWEVPRLEHDLEQSRRGLWEWARRIGADRFGEAPCNPDRCHDYGRACDFFPVCSGAASLEDPTLFRRASVSHEELNQNGEKR